VLQLAKTSNLTAAQVIYKVAQIEGVIPLSGTTNEVHMCEGVAIEGIAFADDGTEELLQAVRDFIKG
jgi:diketogulonate reductase-like aldo/keto reductase